MHATIGGMWTMMAGWGMVVHGGGWWCVEDGGGVCGQSSQACFHAESIEMDNLTLTRRSSTYEACAHVPPICIPRLPPPWPLSLRTRRQIAPSIQSTIRGRTSTDASRHHASRNHPRANTKEKNRKRGSSHAMPRVHNFNLMYARPCSSVPT